VHGREAAFQGLLYLHAHLWPFVSGIWMDSIDFSFLVSAKVVHERLHNGLLAKRRRAKSIKLTSPANFSTK
jgi:hypothetical protein